MKKILARSAIAFVAVLAALVLALPYGFGREAERSYQAMLDRLSRDSPLQFHGRSYRRGWLSSTAESVVRVPGTGFEIVTRQRIEHGPWPISRVRAGEWRPAQAYVQSELRTSSPSARESVIPLHVDLLIHLNGSATLRLALPPVQGMGESGQTIDTSGFSADVHFDREGRSIRIRSQLPSLTLTAPPGRALRLTRAEFRSETRVGASGYPFGEAAFSVERLAANDERGHFELQGLALSARAKPAGANVHLDIDSRFEALQTDAGHYGRGRLGLELHPLDAAALAKFRSDIDALYRGQAPAPQAAMMLAGRTLELLAALSRQAPELEVTHLNLQTAGGEITGRAKFVLDGRTVDLARNPMLLFTRLAGDAEIRLPTPFVKQLLTPLIREDIEAYRRDGRLSAEDIQRLDPPTLARIVDRVYPRYLTRHAFTRHLVEDDGQYQLVLRLRRGQLQLNGQPWHLPLYAARVP